jgi:hypothetical protein
VRGTITWKQEADPEPVQVDVHLVRGRGGRGSISPADSTMQVIVIGTDVYLTGDKRFLTKAVGAKNVAHFRGKYVPGTTADAKLARLATLLNQLDYASMLPADGLRPGPAGMSGTGRTVTYTGGGVRLVVADDETNPVPLHYTGSGPDGPVDLTFAYEAPAELEKPPKSRLLS